MKRNPVPAPADPAGTVRLSKAFVADFAYVARMQKWDADNIAENRQACRDDPQYRAFIACLADSYRNWYQPGPENIPVDAWRRACGFSGVDEFVLQYLTQSFIPLQEPDHAQNQKLESHRRRPQRRRL